MMSTLPSCHNRQPPLPVCQFAQAHRCRRFGAEVAFGEDTLVRQVFYGLRIQVCARTDWLDVIARFEIAHSNAYELVCMSWRRSPR